MERARIYRLLVFVASAMLTLHGGAMADDIVVGSEKFTETWAIPDLLDDEAPLDDSKDGDGEAELVYAPLESLNRVSFEFNDKLYFWVLKPVKTGYTAVVPEDFRMVFGNFFFNLRGPVRLVNNLLQGRFKGAGIEASRFVINSTVGVLGFGDVAADAFDMKPQLADFGQTLGVYGIGNGIYICWPFFGPSNVRDSIGLAGDIFMHPMAYADLDTTVSAIGYSTEFVNKLSITPDVYEEMKRVSLDPYVAARQAYIDYRRSFIKNYDM